MFRKLLGIHLVLSSPELGDRLGVASDRPSIVDRSQAPFLRTSNISGEVGDRHTSATSAEVGPRRY